MQKVQIKMRAAVIANHAAGSVVECITDNGTLYVPALDLPEMGVVKGGKPSADEDEPAPTKSKAAPAAPAAPAVKKGKVYLSEEELEEKSNEFLTELLKNCGEDPDDYEGKNTHRKLVDLAWNVEPEDGFDAKQIPSEEEEAEEVEEEEAEEAPAAKKSVPSKAAKKSVPTAKEEVISDFSDLEKGDSISAFWKNLGETYSGTVKSVKGDTVTILWEDNEVTELDPKVHTKVVRLPE